MRNIQKAGLGRHIFSGIVGASLGAAMMTAMAATIAAAQTAPSETAAPAPVVLAGLQPPHDSKTHSTKTHQTKKHEASNHAGKAHAAKTHEAKTHVGKVAHAKAVGNKHHVAAGEHPVDNARQAAQQPDGGDAAVAADALAAPPAPSPPAATAAAPPTPTPAEATLRALVVNGETVAIDPPDQINEIDRTADNNAPAANAAPAPQSGGDGAATAKAALVAPVKADASPVGSVSWIAQVLAALGGAIAAGAVAWFLIGGGPQRSYG